MSLSVRSVIRALRGPCDPDADTGTDAPAAAPESADVITYSARAGDLPNGIPEPSRPAHASDSPAGAAGQG